MSACGIIYNHIALLFIFAVSLGKEMAQNIYGNLFLLLFSRQFYMKNDLLVFSSSWPILNWLLCLLSLCVCRGGGSLDLTYLYISNM